jgi:hypothetical protein
MIVYRGSDIKYSWEQTGDKKKGLDRVCGYVREDGTVDEDGLRAHSHDAGPRTEDQIIDEEVKVEVEGEEDDDEEELEDAKARVKRQEAEAYKFQLRKTRCPLLLVADYRCVQFEYTLTSASRKLWK